MDVRTRDQFIEAEIAFWDNNTPIGKIFQVGVIMGFVVGVLICYQVLFNDISDHMPEFATLMAMGYSSGYFIWLVVREADLPGPVRVPARSGDQLAAVRSDRLCHRAARWLTPGGTSGLILPFTVIMCILSGLFAVRKLLGRRPGQPVLEQEVAREHIRSKPTRPDHSAGQSVPADRASASAQTMQCAGEGMQRAASASLLARVTDDRSVIRVEGSEPLLR